MGAINKDTHPQLYQQMTEGNLRRQFELLRDMVSVGLQIGFRLNAHIIHTVHGTGTVHLVEKPGHYREDVAHITGSDHKPPPPEQVPELMRSFIVDLHRRWDGDRSPYLLAAFVLWRLLWIHPFEDGNGRAARALAYMTICLKAGQWLPGTKTLLIRIKESAGEYKKNLQHADTTHAKGEADLIPLAQYLSRLVLEQVSE